MMRLASMLVVTLVFASTAVAVSTGRIISAGGVRCVVPLGWQRVRPADPGPVTDPSTLLVVGTAGVLPKPKPTPSRCEIAKYQLPPTGAVVVVFGWKRLSDSGAQGQKPGRWPLNAMVAVRRGVFECFSGRGAGATLTLGGKAYQVNVMVGDRASKQRVANALAVGRSFDLVR
jgi:hypothetical protein